MLQQNRTHLCHTQPQAQAATRAPCARTLHVHKELLLLVLKCPDIVLHTDGSEGDFRGCVKWRKITGGTGSEALR